MTVTLNPALHASPADAQLVPNDPGHPSVRMLAHGSMEVRWYRPHGEEKHLPHDRDEVYVVIAGSALFHRGNDTVPFDDQNLGLLGEQAIALAVGDVVFVPAGTEHRFDNLSHDFKAWTVFYGPEGGERP